MTERSYQFLAATTSFCETCEKLVPAKLAEEEGKVYLLKYCPEHGLIRELYEHDAAWQKKKTTYDRPGTATACETALSKGCPYDCGLCPAHDQHTCIGLVEVTNACDLGCPLCYASAGSEEAVRHLSLEKLGQMMEFYWNAEEGKAEILQISGGEPTTHPEILSILRMARKIGFPMVMLNTNGLRIAEDPAFADSLTEFSGQGFEVYLQFDSLSDYTNRAIRGRPLAALKRAAVDALCERNIPVTLVSAVSGEWGGDGLGELLTYAMNRPGVRGVNFQPVAYFGRQTKGPRNPATLSGVLGDIERQMGGLLKKSDFVPLPCNVERVAITYLLRQEGRMIPITRGQTPESFGPLVGNTFLFTAEAILKNAKENPPALWGCKCMDFLNNFKSALPADFLRKTPAEKKRFIDTSTFRISVSSFVDMRSFDLKSMQKECVHIITEDCRRIPFSAFNMIHRSCGKQRGEG